MTPLLLMQLTTAAGVFNPVWAAIHANQSLGPAVQQVVTS